MHSNGMRRAGAGSSFRIDPKFFASCAFFVVVSLFAKPPTVQAGADFRVFLVPTGQNPLSYSAGPTMVNTTPGGQRCFELYVENAPVPLAASQAGLPCALSGGEAGSVSYVPGSGQINMFHPAYLHLGASSAVFPQQNCTPLHEYATVRFDGASPAVSPRYIGQFCLDVTSSAMGTFTLDFDPPNTMMFDGVGGEVPGSILEGLILEVTPCSSNAECDDGLVCTQDLCNLGKCLHTPMNGLPCPDAFFCNGAETCQGDVCSDAPDPCIDQAHCDELNDTCLECLMDGECDDGVDCTVDTCVNNACVYTPDDGLCDDGAFCNGVETCDDVLGCQPGSDPCAGFPCDEINDECVVHNCCETGHGPGCDDPILASCVCAIDPYCCDVDWDAQCVEEVEIAACDICPGLTPQLDCDGNGVADNCDIACGSPGSRCADVVGCGGGADLNMNNILDVCELADAVIDPQGDAHPLFNQPGELLDLQTVSVTFDDTHLHFLIRFHTPIQPPSAGAPNSATGFLELDLDQHILTGVLPTQTQDAFSPPLAYLGAGVDVGINFFIEPAIVHDVITGQILDFVFVTYGPKTMEGSVPLASLGDDGVAYFTCIMGTFQQPTDALEEVGTSGRGVLTPPSLHIVDPNPVHLAGGALSTDPARLSGGGRLVGGIAADGVTPVLLRFHSPEAGSVQFTVEDELASTTAADVGTLRNALGGAAGNPLMLNLTAVNNDFKGFAALTSPLDFVRTPSDEPLGQGSPRLLTVRALFTPTGGGPPVEIVQPLELVRPPVVLIHGLWSNGKSWGWPQFVGPQTRFVVWNHDYGYASGSAFTVNREQPRLAVANALKLIRRSRQNIAATQADYIGHSMGGLLGRMYVAGPQYLRHDNLLLGDIHKFVTLDTPHKGSEWGDFLDNTLGLVNPQFTHTILIAGKMRESGFCPNCGAVRDLKTDSIPITTLPRADVPCHAIAGTGGSDLIAHGVVESLPREIGFAFHVAQAIGYTPGQIFAQLGIPQHDLIVGFVSQQGGLPPAQFTPVGEATGYDAALGLETIHFGLPFPPGNTIGVPVNPVVGSRAVQLLNARTVTSGLFAPFFPAAPFEPAAATLFHAAAPSRFASSAAGLVFTAPLPGEAIFAGAPYTVTVEGAEGFVPSSVLILSYKDAVTLDTPPFTASLEMPPDAYGSMTISAIAFDADDNVAVADDVPVNVTFTASPTAIMTVEPQVVSLFAFAPSIQLRVFGGMTDGIDRELTEAIIPFPPTTYTTDNPSVAGVSGTGLVSAFRIGVASITVHNLAYFDVIMRVEVDSAPFDADRNGFVDAGDFSAFDGCFSGSLEDPGYEAPVVECTDFFDDDDDGDVDCLDWMAFEAAWTAPSSPPVYPTCEGCTINAECGDAQLCTLDRCDAGACANTAILYADVNYDDFVNLADTLCLLDTFAGNPGSAACADSGSGPPVSLEAKDIAPCPTAGDPANMGDGFVNLGDVLATLDVFAGIGPDPACAACTQP